MSSIQSVRMYKAEDGSLHSTMEAAYAHNAQYKCLSQMREIFRNLSVNPHIGLMNNPEIAIQMRDAMNKVLDYHRRYKGYKMPK